MQSVELSPCKLSGSRGECHDAGGGLFSDLRKELEVAAPNEGDMLDCAYLRVPQDKSPRDMTKEEIQESFQEVCKAKFKEINGLY